MRFGRDNRATLQHNQKNPREIMRAELDRGETLIWADAPVSIVSHGKTSISTALFGIPFLGFAIFWTWGASQPLREGLDVGIDGFSIFFPMFGIPFILVGLGLVFSPVWQLIKAKYLTYALTDKRLLIREGFPYVRVKSWPINGIKSLSRVGPADGPGNIYFTEEEQHDAEGGRTITKIGFIGISEPKRLDKKIREQMNG